MDKLLSDIIVELTPTQGEKEIEEGIIEQVFEALEEFPISPIVVGSTAKDTDLTGDKDIDIFMRFPSDTTREDLEDNGLKFGKAVFKKLGVTYEIDYSEHPYTKGFYQGYNIEIVPCYGEGGIKSSVDRTPFHTEYVKGKISQKKSLKGEIRLMKKFMKACGTYGAEEKTRGFSGYLVEVIVIHYGGFRESLENIINWNMGEIIDPEKQWDDLNSLKYYFSDSPLVVVDPVDKDRNMGAAVSNQRLAELIVFSREFLDNPSRDFFFPPQRKLRGLYEMKSLIIERGTRFFGFEFSHKKMNQNLIYSQLRKTMNSVVKEIESMEFKVFKSSIWSNEVDTSVIIFEMSVFSVPPVKHHLGPPVDSDSIHQERFHEKYSDDKPYILEGRWVVDTKRRYTNAGDFFEVILKNKNGFGKNLRNCEAKVVMGDGIFEIDGEEWLRHLDSQI